MKNKEIDFVIFDPAVSPSENWELYKRLYIDPYPEKQIILKDTIIEYSQYKKTPKSFLQKTLFFYHHKIKITFSVNQSIFITNLKK